MTNEAAARLKCGPSLEPPDRLKAASGRWLRRLSHRTTAMLRKGCRSGQRAHWRCWWQWRPRNLSATLMILAVMIPVVIFWKRTGPRVRPWFLD